LNGSIDAGGVSGGPGGSTFVFINNQNANSIVCFAEGGGGGAREQLRTIGGADGRAGNGTLGRGADGGAGGAPSGQPCAGSFNQFGQQGSPGYLIIEYQVSQQFSAPASWSDLLSTISNQFQNSFGRRPSFGEVDFWVDQYINSGIDLGALSQSIAQSGAFRSNGLTTLCQNRI
jgi:hypothetical protein